MLKYNPFNPNSVVAHNLFAGRVEQVSSILKKLSQLKYGMASSFFIYGIRGIGKTALSKLIRYISNEKDKDLDDLNLLTSYYSVEYGQTLSSVLQESLNKLTEEMDAGLVQEIGNKIGKLFQNGKFQIGAFGMSLGYEKNDEGKECEITVKDQVVSILLNIVKLLEKSESDKQGILIIIDEIHNLKDLSSAASIFRNIITTLDVEGFGKISFLVIGYEEDVESFFSKDSSARRNFDLEKLDVMPLDEAADILKKGFKAASISWDENVLKKNIEVTGGYPHFIQVIGQILVNNDKDNVIDQEDWNEAIFKAALILQGKGFSSMYSFNKPLTDQDKILILLTEENKALTRQQINEKLSLTNIYTNLARLREKGAIVENKDKTIMLQSQLFRISILIDQHVRKYNIEKNQLPLIDAG